MKGIIDEYAAAKFAARDRVLKDERLRLVAEIARLTADLAHANASVFVEDHDD